MSWEKELRKACKLEDRGIIWSLRDLRPSRSRNGLVPVKQSILVMLRYEEGAGASITAVRFSHLNEDYHPVFGNGFTGFYKLLQAKRGYYKLSNNWLMERLARDGARLLECDEVPSMEMNLRAFVDVDRVTALRNITKRLISGELLPAKSSDLRAPFSGTVKQIIPKGEDVVLVVERSDGMRTIHLPAFLRLNVKAGMAITRGSLMGHITDPSDREQHTLMEVEAEQVYRAGSYDGMVRADIVGMSGKPYFSRMGWRRATKVSDLVVEPNYRYKFLRMDQAKVQALLA